MKKSEGLLSRAGAKALIAAGAVEINGKVEKRRFVPVEERPPDGSIIKVGKHTIFRLRWEA